MDELTGLPVSPGYGRGPALVYCGTGALLDAIGSVTADDTREEAARFRKAVAAARSELRVFARRLEQEYGKSAGDILHAQFLMLDDKMLADAVQRRIGEERLSAEGALAAAVREIGERLQGSSHPYLRERTADVHDIGVRILRHLADRTHHPLARLPSPVVVVAEELLPSDTVFLDRAQVRAIVTEHGSENSHAAILARALGIPAVSQVRGICAVCRPGDDVAVDGVHGRVILRPGGVASDQHARRAESYERSVAAVLGESRGEASTLDGVRVCLLANVDRIEDTEIALLHGAEGIGLLRTEFLYLTGSSRISEDEQVNAYRRIADLLGDRPITVRTLDLAADKLLPLADDVPMAYAAITERGVHFSLQNLELFRPQLRAVLRAARHGRFRILLPMVTGVEEINTVRRLVADLRRDLEREGMRLQRPVPIGAMVETLPAVLMAPEIARAADFISVGTNDLLTYLFASARQTDVLEPESAFEPSLLRALDAVVRAGEQAGKEVSLCGEMAGNPTFTALLIGLGFRWLSMSPHRLAEVRYNVRGIDAAKAAAFARAVLAMSSTADVREAVLSYADPWRRLVDRHEAEQG